MNKIIIKGMNLWHVKDRPQHSVPEYCKTDQELPMGMYNILGLYITDSDVFGMRQSSKSQEESQV